MDNVRADVLGASEAFLQFEERLGLLARTDRPVLVLGERGTGKELAVQRLHYRSARWEKPLVTVLCPALSPTLLESELFGHEAGAFTGARGRRVGYLERAHGGTLFLDEVADMPLALQDKLLRVIEYGEFERVGGAAVRVDVRVVGATNGDLPKLAREGRFRADLLDRLAFDVLHVPPLRQRGEDIELLARHFAMGMAAELGLLDSLHGSHRPKGSELNHENNDDFSPIFGPAASEILKTYRWPGNIRELKNVVERSVARHRRLRLETLDVNPFASPFESALGSDLFLSTPLPEVRPEPCSASCPVRGAVSAEASCRASVQMPTSISKEGGGCGTEEGFALAFQGYLPDNFSLHAEIRALELAALTVALDQAKHKQTAAANLLGLTYHQFRALLKKCDRARNG